jgi:hypothetical protein
MSRLRDLLAHPIAGAICRLLLGGIFLYTAVPKLLHPDAFARLVNGYHVLHPELVNLVGITLPWMELTVGACLVLGLRSQSAALVAAGLLEMNDKGPCRKRNEHTSVVLSIPVPACLRGSLPRAARLRSEM